MKGEHDALIADVRSQVAALRSRNRLSREVGQTNEPPLPELQEVFQRPHRHRPSRDQPSRPHLASRTRRWAWTFSRSVQSNREGLLFVPARTDDQPVVAHYPGVFDSLLACGGVDEDVVHPAPGFGDLQLREPSPVNGVAYFIDMLAQQ